MNNIFYKKNHNCLQLLPDVSLQQHPGGNLIGNLGIE